jgi:hypothetical protein
MNDAAPQEMTAKEALVAANQGKPVIQGDDLKAALVEAMARAAYEILPVLDEAMREPWERLSPAVQARYRMEQKAALSAIPAVLERAGCKVLAAEAARAAAEARVKELEASNSSFAIRTITAAAAAKGMTERAEAAEAQAARLREPLAMVWHLICRAVGEHEATREGGGAHVYIDYSDARDILAALTQPSSQEDAGHG